MAISERPAEFRPLTADDPVAYEIEDWFDYRNDHGNGVLVLRCRAEKHRKYDVDIHGCPKFNERDKHEQREFDDFKLDKVVFREKEDGEQVLTIAAGDMRPRERRQWELEAWCMIDLHESLRQKLEEMDCTF